MNIPIPTITICAGCNSVMNAEDESGKPVCPICWNLNKDCSTSMEVELPEEITCASCGTKYYLEIKVNGSWSYRDDSGEELPYIAPPYLNIKDRTFYDGCRGWD